MVNRQKQRIISFIVAFTMVIGLITPTPKASANERTVATDLIISEYLEGSSNNKAIELYNGTGETIDLSNYTVELYSNGNTAVGNKVTLSGTLEHNQTYVIANGSASEEIKDKANLLNAVTNYNGDDTLLLKKGSEVIDSIGQVGFRPDKAWNVNGVSTLDMTLIRKPNVKSGDKDPSNEFDPSAEWTALPKDDISNLGKHTMDGGSEPEPPVEGLISIEQARSESGNTVKVKGIVTFKEASGSSFNYAIQDGTAGIALRGADGLKIGDEVIVEGKVSEFNGLIQLNPYTLIEKRSEGNKIPEAKEVKIADLVDNNGGENYESQRIKLSSVKIGTINTTGNTTLTDEETGKSINIFKSPELPNIKEGDLVDVVGLLSEFKTYQVRIAHESQVTKVGEVEPPTPEEDKVGPEVTSMLPRPGSATGENRKPEISATFTDATAVDMNSVKMSLDGTDITAESIKEGNTVKYTVTNDLSEGKHTVDVEIADTLANKTVKSWTFTVGTSEKNLYFGQLHSHTNLSDGQGSVDEAYTYARDNANLDFFAVTDHSNWFDNELSANIADGSASSEWKQGQAAADKYNKDGDFAAIYGFEMSWSGSTGGYGHINTFNTPGFETRTNKNMDLKNYYSTLKKVPDSISQFNHPGKTFGDFSDFGLYDKEIDKLISLVEVGNGEGPVRGTGYFQSYDMYTRALDKGWHVAPSNNQDNHKGKWGNANTARTVIEASELTRDSVYDALRDMRVYSTEDENLRISYEVNGSTMGSILEKTDTLNFNVNVEDIDNGDNIKKISIIGDGGKVIKSIDNINATAKNWTFTLDGSESSYYYVRVDQADKDIAVTAPIWVGEKDNVGISSVKSDTEVVLTEESFKINTTIYNNEAVDINNVKVEYFLNGEESPIHTETVAKVPKAGTAVSSMQYKADKAGDYEFSVKVTMVVNGVEKIFTGKTLVEVTNANEVSKVIIDGSHFNQYVTGNYAGKMTTFVDLIASNGGKPIINMGEITDDLLKDVSLLVLTDPESKVDDKYGLKPSKYTASELNAIKKFTDRGGNLIIASRADYGDATGEYQHSVQGNVVLEKIGATTRFNDDQVADYTENGGQQYRLYFDDYNTSSKWLEGVELSQKYSFYSGCSVLVDKNNKKSEALVYGHSTTVSDDADKQGDNTPVKQGEVVGLAIETLDSGSTVVVSGTSFLSDFEIDGDSAEQYSNRSLVNALLKQLASAPELPVSKIEEVRVDKDNDNNPDRFGETVVVEGYVTSASNIAAPGNSFFDVIYIQDETAGLTVFGVSTTDVKLGQKVRIKGRVSSYLGDAQVAIKDEANGLQIIDSNIKLVNPRKLSTKDSMLESNEGLLVQVEGVVTRIEGQNIFVNDGSGEARVYTEGYIGSSTNPGVADEWKSRVKVGDNITAIGLASEDPEGHRLRVRDSAEIVVKEESSVVDITILHTNDSHGRVVADKNVIGIDTIAAIRKNFPNSILVDAGDTIHGLPFATMKRGQDIIDLMKLAGYSYMAPGNHDFNYGYERLVELANAVKGDDGLNILSANALKNGSPILEANKVQEINGVKVGFFGLSSPETSYKTNPNNIKGIEFANPIDTARSEVEALKALGAEVIIAIAHIGMDDSTEITSIDIASEVPGIDVIVDGHSHSTYPNGLEAPNGTLIVSTGQYEGNLGKLTLSVDKNTGDITAKKASLISKSESLNYTPDQEVKDKIDEIKASQDLILNQVIGNNLTELDGIREHVRAQETNLGNLLTDAMLDATKAEIAITNGGGIRASINVGEITKGEVISVLPFGNYVVTKYLTGAEIKDILEHGVKDAPNVAGQFAHVAGIRFVYDQSKPAGSRIAKITINGESLDMNKKYLVATNDFMAAGGDNYPHFKDAATENEFAALDEVLAAYITKLGDVDYKLEGRITLGSLASEVDKETLRIVVEYAKGITEEELSKVVPAVVTEFRAALSEAEKILSATDATKEEVAKSFDRLTKVIQMLSFIKGDKTQLINLVDKIEKLDSNEFIPSTWTKLLEVLSEAKAVIEDENALEEEVSRTYEKLMRAYLELRLKPNKDKLENLINKADKLDKALYTEESWNLLQNALVSARTVLNDDEASKDNVEKAEKALEVAMNSLVIKDSQGNNNQGGSTGKPGTNGGTSLPNTGGTNTIYFLLLGAVLVGSGAIVVFKKKSAKENKEAK